MLNVIIGPIDVPNAIISTPRFPHRIQKTARVRCTDVIKDFDSRLVLDHGSYVSYNKNYSTHVFQRTVFYPAISLDVVLTLLQNLKFYAPNDP
jgi:hypothetical protein